MPTANFYLNRPFQKGSGKKLATKILNPNETMIFLYITFPGRNIIKVSTGEKILAKDWDFKKKAVKSTSAGSLTFNSRLTFLKSEVLQAIALATTENPALTFSMIRQIVENALNGKKLSFEKKNLLDYYDMFLDEVTIKGKTGTVKKFKSFKNVLIEYLNYRGVAKKDFYFESIDHEFELYFRDYLINVRENVNNTISKAFESLSAFMQWGMKKKFHKNSMFEDFNTFHRDKGEVIFLELHEVRAIEALDLQGTEEIVRDIFLFALYTGGQRIGDVLAAKTKDIQLDENQLPVDWNLYQIKNKKTIKNTLPLLDKAITALVKYYKIGSDLNSLIFPNLTEQHINRTIKEICSKAGINNRIKILRYRGVNPIEIERPKSEFISFHSARRSFVSIALSLGMDPELIIKFTGHSSTRIMRQHYLGITNEFKREALFKVWQPDSRS